MDDEEVWLKDWKPRPTRKTLFGFYPGEVDLAPLTMEPSFYRLPTEEVDLLEGSKIAPDDQGVPTRDDTICLYRRPRKWHLIDTIVDRVVYLTHEKRR